MPDRPKQSASRIELRATADKIAQLKGQEPQLPEQDYAPSSEELRNAMHELSVHEIELELQNKELLNAQEALEASRARYFDLYDLAPVGYLTIGEDGVVSEANLTASNLLGTERSRLVGKHFSHVIAPEDQDAFYLWRRRLLEMDKPQVCELRLLREGKQSFWSRIEASVVLGSEGASKFHTVISDISERKLAESEQARLQTQLAHSQKMEAIGSLASGIAHDFNNILTGILGGLSLLEYQVTDATQRQDITQMRELVGRATHLTRALLGFARRGKVDVRPLDLALEVEEITTMFGRTRKDIVIQREIEPGLHSVLMDRTQLAQVLLNLFINSGQAMPQGGRLFIRMANEEHEVEDNSDDCPRHFVKLVVTDTGVGMDEATQLRIFEPFFTTKKVGEGSGLGLASVYGIVEGHGGHIQVESRLGQGTTFTLHLPGTNVRPRASTMSIPPAQVAVGHGTILIVDDEEYVRNVYSRMLRKLGYTVLIASGGAQALELAAQHRDMISLVILDMTMPEMSGPETYHALKAMTSSIKVLFSSGHSTDWQAQQVHANGCNGYIQKPFDMTTLAAQVRIAMGSGVQ